MARTVSDIITAAALEIGAVQMGEPLTAAEQAFMLATWQRLIDSMGLERANVHTVRQDTYPLVANRNTYTMGLDPRGSSFSITAASNAYPTVLTVGAHGQPVGSTISVQITSGEGLWQAVNGAFVATVVSSTTLSIPVDSTAFGAMTGSMVLQFGGTWTATRPSKITAMNLLFGSGVLTPISLIAWQEYSELALTVPPQPASGAVIANGPLLTGPPLKAYCDYDAPVATVRFYPAPNDAYNVVVYSEQSLEQVSALTDVVTFAQGYERYHVLALGVESADGLGVTVTRSVAAKLANAEQAIKSRNRVSPNAHTDPALTSRNNTLYNYRLGL